MVVVELLLLDMQDNMKNLKTNPKRFAYLSEYKNKNSKKIEYIKNNGLYNSNRINYVML